MESGYTLIMKSGILVIYIVLLEHCLIVCRQKIQSDDMTENKTRDILMKVSHCGTPNERVGYAQKLSEFIKVDIVGRCGRLRDSDVPKDEEYLFYLSFENHNCDDYITEKFFKVIKNGRVVPVVMGASRGAYDLFGPQVSKTRFFLLILSVTNHQ